MCGDRSRVVSCEVSEIILEVVLLGRRRRGAAGGGSGRQWAAAADNDSGQRQSSIQTVRWRAARTALAPFTPCHLSASNLTDKDGSRSSALRICAMAVAGGEKEKRGEKKASARLLQTSGCVRVAVEDGRLNCGVQRAAIGIAVVCECRRAVASGGACERPAAAAGLALRCATAVSAASHTTIGREGAQPQRPATQQKQQRQQRQIERAKKEWRRIGEKSCVDERSE